MRACLPAQRLSIGHHADVAQAVSRLLDAASPAHRIYNVVDDEAPTLATLFASVGALPLSPSVGTLPPSLSMGAVPPSLSVGAVPPRLSPSQLETRAKGRSGGWRRPEGPGRIGPSGGLQSDDPRRPAR